MLPMNIDGVNKMVKSNKIHYYIDMDGVLADHDRQAREFQVKIDNTPENDPGTKYDISDYGDAFFGTMPPMPDIHLFQDYLKGIDSDRVHILSAVPKRRTSALSVFDEKKDWIKQYFPYIRSLNIHIVFREHKALFPSLHPHSILIDDNKNNINEWKRAGGIGILHTDALSSIKKSMAVHTALWDLI